MFTFYFVLYNNFLIIDTSNHLPFSALIVENNVFSVKFLDKSCLSFDLENSVKQFLEQCSELDFVAVCSGPGNFSAIRTGVAFASGLRLSLDIPIIAWDAAVPFVSSFHDTFVTIIDGGKKGCFMAVKEKTDKDILIKEPMRFFFFEELATLFRDRDYCCLVGPYLVNIKEFFDKKEIKYFAEEKEPDLVLLKSFCSSLFLENGCFGDIEVSYLKEII